MDVTVLSQQLAAGPRVFDSAELPADEHGLATLSRGVTDVDLAAPPVVLPDFHHKADLEMPSSIAVATRETIRPAFTSASVNCGMALIALDSDVPDERAIDGVLRRRAGNASRTRPAGVASCPCRRAAGRRRGRRLRGRAVRPAGAVAGADRGERPTVDWTRTAGSTGCAASCPGCPSTSRVSASAASVPATTSSSCSEVEEVLDPAAAEVLGVQEGQLTLQFHAGGGVLTGRSARCSPGGRRSTAPCRCRWRLPGHWPTSPLPARWHRSRSGWQLYFRPGCPPVPLQGREGSAAHARERRRDELRLRLPGRRPTATLRPRGRGVRR